MKKVVIFLVLLFIVTACGKEEVPVQKVPEKPDSLYVPPPEPIDIEPAPQPENIEDVELEDLPEPVSSEPVPVEPVVSGRPKCEIFGKIGEQYIPADIETGEISVYVYNDLEVCYPYFAQDQANTQAMCCVI